MSAMPLGSWIVHIYHVGRQFSRNLSWNMTDLGAHDILDSDGIAIVLVTGIPDYENTFIRVGTTPVKAHTHNFCRNNTC